LSVHKKLPDTMDDDADSETVTAGPVAVLSSVLIAVMSSAILYNVLWRQAGHEPRATERYVEITAGDTGSQGTDPLANTSIVRKTRQGDRIVMALQKELAAQGLFDGPIDGVVGSKTRQAILSYQKNNGLAETGKPNRKLLDHVRFTRQLMAASDYTNSLGQTLTGDEQVRRLQKGLAELGYRPGKLDGFMGDETRNAIRQFERDRGWPITGEISNSLLAELADIGALPASEAH
jgi:peptidoglycan hydrolase-like protein with peptidoglycan-binding domain